MKDTKWFSVNWTGLKLQKLGRKGTSERNLRSSILGKNVSFREKTNTHRIYSVKAKNNSAYPDIRSEELLLFLFDKLGSICIILSSRSNLFIYEHRQIVLHVLTDMPHPQFSHKLLFANFLLLLIEMMKKLNIIFLNRAYIPYQQRFPHLLENNSALSDLQI